MWPERGSGPKVVRGGEAGPLRAREWNEGRQTALRYLIYNLDIKGDPPAPRDPSAPTNQVCSFSRSRYTNGSLVVVLSARPQSMCGWAVGRVAHYGRNPTCTRSHLG